MIKVIITTLDNLPMLREQISILRNDPLIEQIIVVNNGGKDGTAEYLNSVAGTIIEGSRCSIWVASENWRKNDSNIIAINRLNYGAGSGRNTGLNVAGKFDYILMLDGGIRPLVGGTEKMLEYLERHPVTADRFERVDVIGAEIPHLETDPEKAWRRWPKNLDIQDPRPGYSEGACYAYHNWRLSQTAYCLARREAFDGIRFCEEGPFGEPGWGADDDEMMCQWRDKGIIVHAVCNIHPYRRASGSFRRLFQETGVWPNQYGSVYEKRVVWLQQNWPQYSQGIQWGEPWLTVVIKVDGMAKTVGLIKQAHDLLRKRRFAPPWDTSFNPYSIVAWCPEGNEDFLRWAEHTRLRQHQGDTIVVNGNILHRNERNEKVWTGDFHIWREVDWCEAIRSDAHYYTFVSDAIELEKVIDKYDDVFPPASSSEERPEAIGVEL